MDEDASCGRLTYRPQAQWTSFRPFAKDPVTMRVSILQCALVLLLTISFSGCYSGGKWTMPNLAFWKSSPFSSATASTYPPAPAIPTKPSALAANTSSPALTTAPIYQAATSNVTTPAAAVTPQYSYPS